jgi:AcrR family transcriptional regulator
MIIQYRNIGECNLVQVLKEKVKEKIYQAAIEEFYKKGFLKAKMQDIAKKAGISVGLTYSYYNNKEDLFAAIAGPIYKEIIQPMENEERRDSEIGDPSNLFEQESAFILQLLRQKREIFLILIDRSKGTRFEKAKERIINVTKEHIKRQLSPKVNSQIFKIDEAFYHILANNFIEGLLEIARHYQGSQWAENMLKLLTHQFFYGVSGFHR